MHPNRTHPVSLLWNLLWTAASAHPLDWSGPLGARFAVSQWGVADGLPQSSVTDLAQSSEGYLYASTFGGLARFDGVRFLVVDPTRSPDLPSIRFTAVATDDTGRLWVGMQDGGVAELVGSEVVVLPDPGLPQIGPIRSLLPIGEDLWAAGRHSLVRLHEGAWSRYDWPANSVVGTTEAVWVGGNDGLARIVDGVLTPVPIALPNPVAGLFLTPDGRELWVATEVGVEVLGADGSDRVVYRIADGAPTMGGAVPAVDPEGRVWIGHGLGLDLVGMASELLASTEPARTPLAHLELTDAVRVSRVDREGHLWVGTDLDGLLRINPLPFDRFVPTRSTHTSVLAMDASARPTLVAPVCSGVWLLGDAGYEKVPDGGADLCVGAVRRLRDGSAVYGGVADLYRVASPPELLARLPSPIAAITESADGTLWIGTETGAWTLRDGIVAPVPDASEGLVSVIVEAGDGAMWLGHGSGVTVIRRTGVVERLNTLTEQSNVQIRSILVDADGTGWVGTYGAGLLRVTPDGIFRFTEQNGLPENVVSAIVDDGRGFLWLNGNRGVCRIPRVDLEALAQGVGSLRALRFPTGEGNGGSWPSASVDAEGRLWFATIRGAVSFDPSEVFSNEVPPIPIIEEIVVDGTPYPVAGGWKAPPGDRSLTIRYTTAVLGEADLARFQYRLFPVEEAWHDADDQREIHYAQVAPGTYRFEVRAANEDGVWSVAPATAPVRLAYRPQETGWFRAGTLVTALGLVLGAFQLRSRAQRSRNAALQDEIGQRRRVEAQLRVSEAHYRSVFEAASDGLLVVDAEGRVQDANAAAAWLFGDPNGGLRGRPRDGLVDVTAEPHRAIRVDGITFPARVSTVPLGDGRELTSVADLAPLVALRDRLAHVQRLEAIGRLAGGVAHDFNNLLTVVRANAAALRGSLRSVPIEQGPMLESLAHIESVAQRGSDLTHQLLAFGQRQLLRPELVDVSALVVRLEGMLRRLVPEGVALAVHTTAPGVVRADPTQTELVLVNLVLNAIDAVRGGGRIDVTVRRIDDAEARRQWPTVPEGGDRVVLTVADTGMGIAPDVLPHVFEPFFTTKGVQGHGLGLASVHGFVTQSRGFVFVRSVPREGATFDIVLPAKNGAPDVRRHASTPPRDPTVPARILVCDDDPLVRRTVERVLKSGGFEVVGADDAAAALALLREARADVLVTDVLMPRVTGIELAALARELQPGIRVVFVSGYTSEVLPSELDGPLVSKPFEPAALLDVVRRSLVTPRAP